MEFELTKDEKSIIKVIGVGGGGSNAVNHMFRQGIKGVDFMICNTDQQALDVSPVQIKITLGSSLTDGRGAGSIPAVGRNAAIENLEELREQLSQTKMVFITAGMGGGTGTGAAPIIAGLAREMGVLTVGIVTLPFEFEGSKRALQAQAGIDELKKNVDTLLVICNDKLREIYGNLTLKSAFSKADDILTTAARGIAEIITVTGYINVDFEDVKTVMTESGVAIMGSGLANGDNRAIKAVQQAIESPLLDDNNIEGAKYILLNITSGTSEVTMDEITEITDYIQREAGMTADVIWGNCEDESIEDGLMVTLIATGFKSSKDMGRERTLPEKKVTVLTPELPDARTNENVAEQKSSVSQEPVLKQNAELEQEKETEEYFSFEFDLSSKINKEQEPTLKRKEENQNEEKPVSKKLEQEPEEANEVLDRAQDRLMRLRQLSLKINSPNGIVDLEKEPAYKRRNIKLDQVPNSGESNVSRYTLTEDDDKKPEIRPNNSFLHDKVD